MFAKRLNTVPEVRAQIQFNPTRSAPWSRTEDEICTLQDSNRWAVILAGGDGARLLPLTRLLTGEDTPKQFCVLTGNETLLAQTQRRISAIVPRQRTLVVVTRTHERYYAKQPACVPDANLLVQPSNRGTAPAILYSLTCLHAMAPRGVVGFFPSDHQFNSDTQFANFADQAYKYAQLHGDRVFLLGIPPDSPEADYGWIEPGRALLSQGGCDAFEVCRFWEKPSGDKARDLMDGGGLWNTFIMIGRVTAFLDLIRSSLPNLYFSFNRVADTMRPDDTSAPLAELYARIPASNFSREVLVECPANLAVLPAQGLQWTDLGVPERVMRTIRPNTGRKRTMVPLAYGE